MGSVISVVCVFLFRVWVLMFHHILLSIGLSLTPHVIIICHTYQFILLYNATETIKLPCICIKNV